MGEVTTEVPETTSSRMSSEGKDSEDESDYGSIAIAGEFNRKLLPESKMTFRRITELCLNKEERDGKSIDTNTVAEKLLNLKIARLDWQGFTEIDCLEAMTNIQDLYLQYNRIRRIENLEFHAKLRFLSLSHNEIESVENIRHLKNLRVLDLSYNKIEVLDLTEFPENIRNLDLQCNPCTQADNYHRIVIEKLAQLVILDDKPIRKPSLGVDTDDQEAFNSRHYNNLERIELKPIRSARSGPTSGTNRSDALMEAALAKIDELSRDTSLSARKVFSERRKEMIERSKQRMQEAEEAFAHRVVPTIENTKPDLSVCQKQPKA